MTATISFHGPYEYRLRHYPAGTLEDHPEEYGSLTIADLKNSAVTLYFMSREEIEAHLKTVLALRDMFAPADTPAPEPHLASCGHPSNEDGECDCSFWPERAPIPPDDPEHGENHTGSTGHVLGAAHPGDCVSCDGHVDSGGVFHPAQSSLVGRRVADAHDDSPCPPTGIVVRQIDDEFVEVVWGDRETSVAGTREPVDALRPVA